MYVEDFLNHIRFDMNVDKSSTVKLKMYACGREHLVELDYSRLEKDKYGNLVIVADDN